MATATLQNYNGNKRTYINSKGLIFQLEINDEWSRISFSKSGEEFGKFIFKELGDGIYKLIRMYTDPHENTGLGKAAIQMFSDLTQSKHIYVLLFLKINFNIYLLYSILLDKIHFV